MVISFLINDTYCGTIDNNTAIIYYGDFIIYKGLRMASVTFMIETMEADDGDRKNVNSSSELLLLLHLRV